MGRRGFVLAVGVAMLFVALPVGRVEARTFRNCAAVRAKYPNGIAINFAVVGTSGAYIDRRIYLQHQRLDRDKDGIICEDKSKQTAVTTTQTAAPASPTTVATTTTARTRVVITPSAVLCQLRPSTAGCDSVSTSTTTVVFRPNGVLCQLRPSTAGCDSVSTSTTTVRVRTTIAPLRIQPSATVCRVLPSTAGCESLITTTTTATATTTTTATATTTTTATATTTTVPETTTTTTSCVPDTYELGRLDAAMEPWNRGYNRVRPLFIYNGEVDKARILDVGYIMAQRNYDAAREALLRCVRVYWEIPDFDRYYP